MRQTMKNIVLLLLLLSVSVGVVAQSSVKHSSQKSVLGIEVHFRFDKSQLDLDYMGNAFALERFAQVVDSIGLHRIDSVVIVSQSSPEGVYEHNVKLSRRRSVAMRRVIQQRHPELENRLYAHPDGESWERLREYVVRDTKMKQETISQVLRIIDSSVNVGTKKWRLQQLPIYRYLLQTYYPRLRNSVFCIVHFVEDVPEETVDVAVTDTLQIVSVDTVKVIPEDLPVLPKPLQEEEYVREPMFNVHTNLLYDLATAINIGIEYYPHDSRWALLAHYTFPWWSRDKSHRYLQLMDGDVEVRRYFDKDAGHAGHYLAVYGHANLYDFSFDSERAWQGEGAGVGFSYGYVWRPWKDRRWKLGAFIRVGYYQSVYDPYHASEPYNGKYYYDWEGAIEDFDRRNHRLRWVGPTGVGLTLSYDLIQRKLKK